MEERFGFIHGEMDIKVLILFILRRLPEAVSLDTLTNAVLLCDEGFGYFDFAECVADLVKTEHIAENDGMYKITEKGCQNGEVTEPDLPYSVRIRAERAATALAQILQRDALITASHEVRQRGGYTVKLGMSDGIGPIISMELLAGDDKSAALLERNFRKNAENIYNKIIDLLTEK